MTGRYGQYDHANSVAREIRATMDAVRPESVLLAEHCHDASGDLTGDGWQGTMNYAGFTRPVWSWLTASDNGLGFLGMPVGVPRRPGMATMSTMRATSRHRCRGRWRAGTGICSARTTLRESGR